MIAASGRHAWNRGLMSLTIRIGLLAVATGSVVAITRPELVLVATAAGVAALAAVISPANGLRILMVSAMAGGFSMETSYGNLRLDQAAVLPVFVGALARRLADSHIRTVGPRTAPLILFAAAYLAMNLATSLFLSPDPLSSLRIVLWLGLSGVAMLITVIAIPAYIDGRRALLELTAIGAVAASIGALTYFLGSVGVSNLGTQIDPVSGALATKGTFFEANLLGSFSAAIAILAVSLAVFDDGLSRRARLWLIWFAVVSAAACLGSLTRAAWLGLAVGLAIVAIIGFRAFPRARVVVRAFAAGTMLVVITAALGLGATFLERSASLLTDSTGSVAFRLTRYQIAFDEWLGGAPLVGLGTNSFGQRHLDPSQGFQPDYLAGLGIATLYDVGVLGLLFLVSVFLVVGARLLRARSHGSDPMIRAAAIAGIAALASLMVSYQATNAFWFSYNWILIGIFATLLRTKPTPTSPSR